MLLCHPSSSHHICIFLLESVDRLVFLLDNIENEQSLGNHPLALYSIALTLQDALKLVISTGKKYPYISLLIDQVISSVHYQSAVKKLDGPSPTTSSNAKSDKKKKNATSATPPASTIVYSFDDIVKPTLNNIDWGTTGLMDICRDICYSI